MKPLAIATLSSELIFLTVITLSGLSNWFFFFFESVVVLWQLAVMV